MATQRNSRSKQHKDAAEEPATTHEALVQAAQDFSADELSEALRVYSLARMLGVTSQVLVAALQEHGWKKRAQSKLTQQEAQEFLAALVAEDQSGDQPAEPASEAETARIKHRVSKAVENEIHQIEDKVNAQLQAQQDADEEDSASEAEGTDQGDAAVDSTAAEATEKVRHRVSKAVENEIHQIEQKVEQEVAALQQDREELLVAELEETSSSEAPEPEAPVQRPALPRFVAPTLPDPLVDEDEDADSDSSENSGRRRGKRGQSRGRGNQHHQAAAETDHDEVELIDAPKAIQGSTRLEAQRRRRQEMREEQRNKRQVVSQAEFLARRESVTRTMVVCERQRDDAPSNITQVGVLEDDVLVEHLVANEAQASSIGNIYLGRVQNVLPSMEAVFIDIGTGRNAVLYASDVKWREQGLRGRQRTISNAFSSGDQVLVQVTKDPLGHKGARLTTHISLAGRYLVYVPEGRNAGISRKLPEPERKRLKSILRKVVPEQGGAIIRTAAEGAAEEAIAADVQRLHSLWLQIQQRAQEAMDSPKAKPVTLYEEPNPLVRLIRDLFNEDFSSLIVDGKRSWNTVQAYVKSVAPDLADRLEHYDPAEHDGRSALEEYRIDEQLQKALSRKVWLPSGGTLVIDRTEAMTVIDVNTGKFTGAKNNLEATVTQNNLEAAEEIVRQMRLRDLGGMIVVDFIDMVLPENQDLVLRRLTEALGRDRTRHQISEVTSLGLVQITRKRLGIGLLETFSTPCPTCDGSGVVIHDYPVDYLDAQGQHSHDHGVRHQDPQSHPAAVAMHKRDQHEDTAEADTAGEPPAKQREAAQKLSFEELADAVVAPAIQAEASGADASDAAQDDAAQECSGRGRRRRRRGGAQRGRGHENGQDSGQQQAQQQEQEKGQDKSAGKRSRKRGKQQPDTAASHDHIYDLVEKALDVAHQHDPDEPSGADYLPEAEATTYEAALAAYEASPRRKRKVRGNSISDVPPRPEGYPEQAGEDADDSAPAASEQAAPPQRAAGDGAQQGRGRRRRRVQQRGEASQQATGTAQQAVEDAAPDQRQNNRAAAVPEDAPQVVRRRRRAAQAKPASAQAKPASAQAESGSQGANQQEERSDAAPAAAKESKSQRRRRRRVSQQAQRAKATDSSSASQGQHQQAEAGHNGETKRLSASARRRQRRRKARSK